MEPERDDNVASPIRPGSLKQRIMRWRWQFEDEQLGIDSTPPKPVATWRKPLLFIVSGGWLIIVIIVALLLWWLN